MKAEELSDLDETAAATEDGTDDDVAEAATEVDQVAIHDDEESSEAATETDPAADEPDDQPKLWWGWGVVAAVLIVAFVVLGTAFELRSHSLSGQTPAKNRALADNAETAEVIGQVSTALNKVLSYDYRNPSLTQQASSQLLTGDAAGQYKTLFTALQQKAPGEQLTLAAKVVVAGVTQLHGNTAQLLVFLDQSSTRASDKQSSTSAAQLDVTAIKQADTWKISELLPL